MAQVGVGEMREVCGECGAVIGDRERHSQWHALPMMALMMPVTVTRSPCLDLAVVLPVVNQAHSGLSWAAEPAAPP
jgi:hypothetical protein